MSASLCLVFLEDTVEVALVQVLGRILCGASLGFMGAFWVACEVFFVADEVQVDSELLREVSCNCIESAILLMVSVIRRVSGVLTDSRTPPPHALHGDTIPGAITAQIVSAFKRRRVSWTKYRIRWT
jgi:hypothetical protein